MSTRRRDRLLLAGLVLVGMAILGGVAAGQAVGVAPTGQAQDAAGSKYSLAWWTVDGGGATALIGGSYTLGGTAGQPDAGLLSGGGYTLDGGFWGSRTTAVVRHPVYLPLVIRN